MKNGAWSQEELDFIKENYKHMSYKEMAEKLGRTKAAVDLKVNRLGLKKSKYVYNEKFFETIDTEEKAYWLGFMYADGYVCASKYRGNISSYEVSIELSSVDKNHLIKFVKSINGNIGVTEFVKYAGTPPAYHNMCSVRIYSKKMFNDLNNVGVVQNKTFIIKFPTFLEENLKRHFIRGYFDGNGSVYENKQARCARCNFTTASKEFIEYISKYLIESGIKCYITHYHNIYQCIISGMYNVDVFRNFLYKDSTVFLDRKFERFVKIYDKYDIDNRLKERLPR